MEVLAARVDVELGRSLPGGVMAAILPEGDEEAFADVVVGVDLGQGCCESETAESYEDGGGMHSWVSMG